MSALFCLFLCFRSYPEKLEVYIPTFYKIRYILEELYVAIMWIISQLIIYIDQMNAANIVKLQKNQYCPDCPIHTTTANVQLSLYSLHIFTWNIQLWIWLKTFATCSIHTSDDLGHSFQLCLFPCDIQKWLTSNLGSLPS